MVNRHGHRRDLGFVSHIRQKKVTKVAPNTPRRCAICVSSSSILSGINVQMAMPMNDAASNQRRTSGRIQA
jgi:hypothetical protein